MKWDPAAYIKAAPGVSALNLHLQENEMKFHAMASAVVLFLLSTAAFAQDSRTPPASTSKGDQASQPNPNPVSTFNKIAYARIKTNLVGSAEKMPEESYNFKPTDSVRSYGQIVGHVADAQYMFCSLAIGDTNPGLKIEQTKTTKADLVCRLLLEK